MTLPTASCHGNWPPKASDFAATGLFSGLNSFAELEVRISALQEEKQRGDAFEVFAGAWVALFYPQNVASQQFWPLDAGLAARLNVDALCDLGIDSILEIDGHLSAIQVKFRGGRKDLSWTTAYARVTNADVSAIRLTRSPWRSNRPHNRCFSS